MGIRVSAVVSTYNSEGFIRGCLEDLTSQTLFGKGELEVIVVDSGSQQREGSVVLEFQNNFGMDRIRYFRTESRETIYMAWNRGIKASSAPLITNANTDDRHRLDALEIMAGELDRNPHVAVVYADQLYSGIPNETFATSSSTQRRIWDEYSYATLRSHCMISSQPMWRKTLHNLYGLFDESFASAGDWEFWLRIGRYESFRKINEILGLYYMNPAGVENTHPQSNKEVELIKRKYGIAPSEQRYSQFVYYTVKRPPTPPVSVIIPCFNYAHFLSECVESVLSQSFKDFEIIIVNDGSSDNTKDVAEKIISAHPEAQIFLINQPNSGHPGKVRNKGIHLACGQYVLCLDADDIIQPSMLEECIDLLENNPDIDIAYTDQVYFGATQSRIVPVSEYDFNKLLQGNFMGYCSLFRKKIWEEVGGFPEDIGYEDWDFWISCGEKGHFAQRIPKPLFKYRIHTSGQYQRDLAVDEEIKARLAIKHPALYSSSVLESAYRVLGTRAKKSNSSDELGIIAIISAHNEGDIIYHVIGDLISNNIKVYLLDNGSTDNTAAEASRWLGKGLLHIERFPDDVGFPERNKKEYVWKDILRRKEELAVALQSDWYIHADADEFRESPFPGTNLAEGIRLVDGLGYNAINFEVLNFRPTDDSFQPGTDVRQHLTGYEPGMWFDSNQIKAWKNPGQRVDLASSGGHSVTFSSRRIFPVPFLLRHYPIRSETHGRKKVFSDRLPRFAQEERAAGWHVQYDEFARGKTKFLHDPKTLVPYDPDAVRAQVLSRALRRLLVLQTPMAEQLERCENLLRSKPDDLRALGEVAEIYLKCRDRELARSTLERILQIQPGNEAARMQLNAITSRPEAIRVSIIIPVFNKMEYTRRCLEALYRNTPFESAFEVIVIDNGSMDGTAAFLANAVSLYPNLKVITNRENRGFAGANNQGAEAARGIFLVFLNNDTEPEARWLDTALAHLENSDGVGIVGSKLLYPNRTIQHCGVEFITRQDRPYELWPEHRLRFAPEDDPAANEVSEMEAVTGACLFIRRDLFLELGGFDESYGLYFEDTDLCFKVRARGKRIFYEPGSVVIHHESKSSPDLGAAGAYLERAAKVFFERWGAEIHRMAMARKGRVSLPAGRGDSIVIGIDARTFEMDDSIARGIGHYAFYHLREIASLRPSWRFVLYGAKEQPPKAVVPLLEQANLEWKSFSQYRRADIDLLHIPDPMNHSPGFHSPFKLYDARRVSVTFHDLIPLTFYWELWPEAMREEYLARLTAIRQGGCAVLTNSEYTRKDLIERGGIPEQCVTAVMAGLHQDRAGRKLHDGDIRELKARFGIDKPYFLHVGALDPHKNFDAVFQSFMYTRHQHPCQLVVVGQMAHVLKLYADQIAARGIKDIIFTGFVTREELEALYADATALVFLSKHEGFGFPVLEAMANGCPVISSNATSIPEVAGDAALLFSPTDTEHVTEAMLRLLRDPMKREELKSRGLAQAARFTWKRSAIRTLAVWENLLLEAQEDRKGDGDASWRSAPREIPSSAAPKEQVRIPIAMPVCDRPQYLRQVIAALRECENLDRFMIVTSEEPGFHEVAAIIDSIDFIPVVRHTHHGRWGCNRNVTAAINYAFEMADRAVILEDDIVPARDFLNFMLWGLTSFESDPHVISVCAYFRSLEPPDPKRAYQAERRHWFTPWGWGTWKDRWERFYRLHQNNLNQNQHSWDYFFNKEYFLLDPENVEVRPLLGRVQNIGEEGTYVPSRDWQRENQQTPYWHANLGLAPVAPEKFFLPGEEERVIDPQAVPTAVPEQAAKATSPRPVGQEPEFHSPILWHAPIFDPSGYADEARHLIQKVADHRPLRVQALGRTSEQYERGMRPEERGRFVQLMATPLSPPFVSIVHSPAYAFQRHPLAFWNIGRTVFETDRIPNEWAARCNQMDEVWVPTDFNVETFRKSGVRVPLFVIPEGVDTDFFRPDVPPLPLSGRRGFAFLSIFEWTYRKGWDLLLKAWVESFKPEDDVCLILRTYPVDAIDLASAQQEIERRIDRYLGEHLGRSLSEVAPIIVLGEQVPQRDMPRLYRSADAFVLPSRGEGWGRPYIEAMACGLPVIGTRWGGNLAFMDDQNSYLIDSEGLVEVDERMEFPFYKGHRWSSPSVEHLQAHLQDACRDRDVAKRKGIRAREDVLRAWTWERGAQAILDRIEAIETGFRKHEPVASSGGGPLNVPSPESRVRVAWEGSQFVHHSLALINRELSILLAGNPGIDLAVVPYEPHQFGPESDPRFKLIADRIIQTPSHPVDVHIRHQWPPNFTPPPSGHWVMIQPWEYGRLPEQWIEPMTNLVDEVWVPSTHVKKSYLASGVPADRVQVIPNGVNVEIFHPEAKRHPLETRKTFKFLFVGGTIWRKGVDVLLEAYRSAFRREDDVVLVIKDMGMDSFYRNQDGGGMIRKVQEDPAAPEILYLTAMLSEREMPGLYAACDCLVHPYRGEGFGLPVLEAMACGLPVIVTAGGATDDFCTARDAFLIPSRPRRFTSEDIQYVGGTGWVLEPDLETLKQTLRHVYEHPGEAREKAAEALERVRAEYPWERVAAQVIEKMKAVVRRPLRRRVK